jgi:hypothetical protein
MEGSGSTKVMQQKLEGIGMLDQQCECFPKWKKSNTIQAQKKITTCLQIQTTF